MTAQRGEALKKVTEGLKDTSLKAAIIFIIDGCRADVLYDQIQKGKMPNLSRLMNDLGHVKYEKCVTVFPSVTIACHASIVTGAYPGVHGIVGNNWFIRKKWAGTGKKCPLFKATREYVKYSWKTPKSDPGLLNGLLAGKYFSLANADLSRKVKTVYEAYNNHIGERGGRSMSILEMVSRGADIREFIDLDDVSAGRGMIFNALNWLRLKVQRKESITFSNKIIDWRAFDNLVTGIDQTGKHRPELYMVWLPGMDGFSHANGAEKQPAYFKKRNAFVEFFTGNLDLQFKRLRKVLKKRNMLNETLMVVTADHGQYDCAEHATIGTGELFRLLKHDETAGEGEVYPFKSGKVLDDCDDATVAISQNGGSCHIYVRGASGWDEYPSPDRLLKFLPVLGTLEHTDLLLARYSADEYRYWEDGTFRKLSELDPELYPLAEERVNSLAATGRAGDIILSAKKPGYYEGKPMNGEHGSLFKEDSLVPLLFIHKDLKPVTEQGLVRTIDIAPTVAASMGFADELSRPGTDRDKLGYILDALEDRVGSYPFTGKNARKLEKELDMGKVLSEHEVETEDMCQNFSAKADAFLDGGSITQEEYDQLNTRFCKLKNRIS